MSDVRILIVCPNWLGDSVMAMPAIQALRDEYVDAHITVLSKSHLADLWSMHAAPDEIIKLEQGHSGMMAAISKVQGGKFDRAFIFPNSFRSGFIPFAARIPVRVGMKGHSRSFMLTEIRVPPREASKRHQMWEYFAITGIMPEEGTEQAPRLTVPRDAIDSIRRLGILPDGQLRVALMPGAAYGESKRWPVEHFCEVVQALTEDNGGQIVLLGTRAEREACTCIADRFPTQTLNLAGRTSLQELAAALESCTLTIANDSGGMHLAVCVGTPVVGIYGITDPEKTGPLGPEDRIVFEKDVTRSRDLARRSAQASAALLAVHPQRVLQEVNDLLNTVTHR